MSSETTSEPFLTEAELRHWLQTEDWYSSAHTREWLRRTPPNEAADVLAHIATNADLEPSLGSKIVMGMVYAGFFPSGGAAGRKIGDRKAGIRAALLLAELNDVRALVPLARVWSVAGGAKQSNYQELIHAALVRLLTHAANPASPEATDALRDVLLSVWGQGDAEPKRDLRPQETELLLAILRFVQSVPAAVAVPIRALVLVYPAQTPNRQAVQEAARIPANERRGTAP